MMISSLEDEEATAQVILTAMLGGRNVHAQGESESCEELSKGV
jgi:hypothetical protein